MRVATFLLKRGLHMGLSGLMLISAAAQVQSQTPFQVQPSVLKMRADGPDAAALGHARGYKSCVQALLKPECRVGAWSASAPAFSKYVVKPSTNPWALPDHEAPPEISWRWGSFSMAKTFTAMLVGIAHGKGLIRSLDDKASDYWPDIANLPVRISEHLNGKTTREVEQGQRFHYASIETEILGRVLRRATGKTITALTEEWLWQPMGAQDRAHWNASTTDGAEAAFWAGVLKSLGGEAGE